MRLLRPLLVALTLFAVAVPVAAQVDRATLTGVIRDPSNAVLPGAAVKVINLSTGVEQTATTTVDGVYFLVNLTPGQ